jgi:hypothetical protein
MDQVGGTSGLHWAKMISPGSTHVSEVIWVIVELAEL